MTVAGWRDLRRLAILIGSSATFGLLANALASHPVPLLSSDGPGGWPELARRVTAEELRRDIEAGRVFLLLDVRSEDSFRKSRSPRALNAPATSFVEHYQRLGLASILKAADGIVILCESGDCSSGDRVARTLAGMGHGSVRVLHGGWKAYCEAGLERMGP
jgi:rhodanese-related sulfurtransferase